VPASLALAAEVEALRSGARSAEAAAPEQCTAALSGPGARHEPASAEASLFPEAAGTSSAADPGARSVATTRVPACAGHCEPLPAAAAGPAFRRKLSAGGQQQAQPDEVDVPEQTARDCWKPHVRAESVQASRRIADRGPQPFPAASDGHLVHRALRCNSRGNHDARRRGNCKCCELPLCRDW